MNCNKEEDMEGKKSPGCRSEKKLRLKNRSFFPPFEGITAHGGSLTSANHFSFSSAKNPDLGWWQHPDTLSPPCSLSMELLRCMFHISEPVKLMGEQPALSCLLPLSVYSPSISSSSHGFCGEAFFVYVASCLFILNFITYIYTNSPIFLYTYIYNKSYTRDIHAHKNLNNLF